MTALPRRSGCKSPLHRAVPWLAAALSTAVAATAQAQPSSGSIAWQSLGPAREISRTDSASRDAAVLALLFAPRGSRKGGGEFSLLSARHSLVDLKLSFFGFLELEGSDEPDDLLPVPDGIRYWRGQYGFTLAASPPSLSTAVCGERCKLEGAVGFGHESEHYTGSNDGGTADNFSDRPHVGDFVSADLAGRIDVGEWRLTGRLIHRFFLPKRSAYRFGPAADLSIRWARCVHCSC